MADIKQDNEVQLIDVEGVFASKDAKLLKRIPKFFIRYLKRIVHQDKINNFLVEHQDLEGIEFVKKGIEFFNIDLEVRGVENIGKNTRIIVVANHPFGGPDGLCLMKIVAEVLDPTARTTSNDLLLNIKPLRNLFVGVNKHGSNSRDYIREMQEVFSGDSAIIFFPSGLVSRRRKGIIEDPTWKRTFIKKAVEHQRDVLPVHITGRVSNFFYVLANIRKFLGIRYNIEMLYLPNEMFKIHDQKVVITFGKPISWKTFTNEYTPDKWAQKVKDGVYEMGKKV